MWKKKICVNRTAIPLHEGIFQEIEEFLVIYGIYCFLKKEKFLGICQIDMKTQTFHPILLIHMVRQVKVLGKTCSNTCDYKSVCNIYTTEHCKQSQVNIFAYCLQL